MGRECARDRRLQLHDALGRRRGEAGLLEGDAQRVAVIHGREREDAPCVAERVEPAQAPHARRGLPRAHRPRSRSQVRLRWADSSTLSNGSPGGEDAILLDHDPAFVPDPEQLLEAFVDLRAARAELAEHACRPGLLEALALGVQAGQQVQVDVLEVHVVDELARLAQERQRVAAAEGRVAGVEAEAEQARVHVLEERLDLARRLDVGAGVGVERRHEPALATQLGGAVDVVEEQALPALAEPGLGMRLDGARVAHAVGLAEGVGEQHDGQLAARPRRP